MPYYLTSFLDASIGQNRISRAVGQEEPGSAIIDLRPDGGATIDGGGFNACLLYRPTLFSDPRAMPLADLADESLSLGRRRQLATALGATIIASRFNQIVGALMLSPPVGKWRPIVPEAAGTRYAAYLGPLAWTQNVIAGGSGGRLVDLYERLQERGGLRRRVLARDAFRRRAPLGWFLWLANLHGLGAILATDPFTRADAGNLGANWTGVTDETTTSNLGIFSNQCDMTDLADTNGDWYNAVAWPNDQYSQCMAGGTLADGEGFARVRTSDTARTYYKGGHDQIFSGVFDSRTWKRVAATKTDIASDATDIAVNDTVYLEIQGTSLLMKVNGANRVGPTTDTSITTGRAGIGAYHGTLNVGIIDTWEGGDFAVVLRADYSGFPKHKIREAILRGDIG